MKKKVEVNITRCSDCPHQENDWTLVKREATMQALCAKANKLFPIELVDSIQDWCPLENA